VALRILSEPSSPEDTLQALRSAIEAALPGARVEVEARGAGHFEISVTSQAFADRSRLAQQQLVYAAIAHLMQGDAAPVHAIDRLRTQPP
jgi:acid stress-induced BolA-like protein IbaG/YrbA